MLLSRTEELRTLDNRRAEVDTELELAAVAKRISRPSSMNSSSLEQEHAQNGPKNRGTCASLSSAT